MTAGKGDRLRGRRTQRGSRHHTSYVLRLWQVERGGRMIWRASLQNSDTGERRGFTTLAGLLRFLEKEYGTDGDAEGSPDRSAN